MTSKYPKLSLRERDRRWNRTRSFLAQRGLNGLLVFGMKGRERYEGYLLNECIDGMAVFPIEGDVVGITWVASRITRRLQAHYENEEFWTPHLQQGLNGTGIASVMHEQGLTRGPVGVVGLDTKGPAEGSGLIPYRLWCEILERLPKVEFVDVSTEYCQLMLEKSDEELTLIRYACEVNERACEHMLDMTKIGASEYDIYAGILETVFRHGAVTIAPNLNLTISADEVGWGPPMWHYRGGEPRFVKPGDVLNAEIFAVYGGMETQTQMAVAVPPVREVHAELADVARRCYEAGLKTLKPGVTFRTVCDAMQAPLLASECWQLTPLIHSLAPLILTGPSATRIQRMPGIESYHVSGNTPTLGADVEIRPGMVFELEPNACRDRSRINIGGAVLTTETGAVELNQLPTRMRVAGLAAQATRV